MTAHPATSKPEPKPADEQSERLLRMLGILRKDYRDLAMKLGDEGYLIQAGMVAGCVAVLDTLWHGMDLVAARLNDRRPKGNDDGIRQSPGGQTDTFHQMPLLR